MSTLLTTQRDQGAPTPEQVRARVAELVALEAQDPTTFAEALADNIVEPEALDTLAFRDEELAVKSAAACRYLVERTDEQMRRYARDKERLEGQRKFRAKVVREGRIMQSIIEGIRAKRGILPNSPNPRRRAERRFISEALAGNYGEEARVAFRRLVADETEKLAEQKRQAKKARRQSRREGGR
jgi:hypothetical protein